MTTNITRTSADGRTSKRIDFTGDDIPLSFRHFNRANLAESTEWLCTFVKYAVPAMFMKTDFNMLSEHEIDGCVMGFQICMDLIKDRLDVASGYRGVPTYPNERG